MSITKNSLPVGDWLTGSIQQTQVNVGTSPTALPTTAQTHRRLLVVYNNGSTTIYLGNSLVTTTNGLSLPTGSFISLSLDAKITLYGIVASGTEDARVFEGS